jgi:hypothetical protein
VPSLGRMVRRVVGVAVSLRGPRSGCPHARGCGLMLEVGPLDAQVTEVARDEVHDRPAEVRAERAGVAQMP